MQRQHYEEKRNVENILKLSEKIVERKFGEVVLNRGYTETKAGIETKERIFNLADPEVVVYIRLSDDAKHRCEIFGNPGEIERFEIMAKKLRFSG